MLNTLVNLVSKIYNIKYAGIAVQIFEHLLSMKLDFDLGIFKFES